LWHRSAFRFSSEPWPGGIVLQPLRDTRSPQSLQCRSGEKRPRSSERGLKQPNRLQDHNDNDDHADDVECIHGFCLLRVFEDASFHFAGLRRVFSNHIQLERSQLRLIRCKALWCGPFRNVADVPLNRILIANRPMSPLRFAECEQCAAEPFLLQAVLATYSGNLRSSIPGP